MSDYELENLRKPILEKYETEGSPYYSTARLWDDGTIVGTFSLNNNSGDFYIRSRVSDKDMLFRGNDGGSEITALTLDMSSAGAATFNSSVNATNYLVGGSQGSDGQVLTSTGSGVAWEDASGGSFNADGAQTFNDSGAAVDFRIESDSDANMFFLDGSANAIGMGTSAPNEGGFGSGSRVLSIQEIGRASCRERV